MFKLFLYDNWKFLQILTFGIYSQKISLYQLANILQFCSITIIKLFLKQQQQNYSCWKRNSLSAVSLWRHYNGFIITLWILVSLICGICFKFYLLILNSIKQCTVPLKSILSSKHIITGTNRKIYLGWP